MNFLYVTVSIPLLLVLAGFNAHAHGLTTFGKSNNQGQQNIQHPPPVLAKACTHQANCSLIKGTTCIKQYCLCGDNSNPVNGNCKAERQGHNHICQNDTECVEGATCKEDKMKPNMPVSTNNEIIKKCQCLDGTFITPSGKCGGESLYHVLFGLIPLMIVLVKLY